MALWFFLMGFCIVVFCLGCDFECLVDDKF